MEQFKFLHFVKGKKAYPHLISVVNKPKMKTDLTHTFNIEMLILMIVTCSITK